MSNIPIISLSGIDFCGKSTQLPLLKKYLESQSLKVFVTKQVGSEHHPVTKQLRDLMLNNQHHISHKATQFLFAVNCLIHKEEVLDTLKGYDVVLSDRGYADFFAYGLEFAPDISWLSLVFEFLGESKPADLTLFYNIQPEIAYARKEQRQKEIFSQKGEDKIEAKGLIFQQRVYQNFFTIFEEKKIQKIIIDVNDKNIDQVYQETIKNEELHEFLYQKFFQ